MNSLVPCPECNRHVRRNEAECPFCGASVLAAIAAIPERAMPTARLSRSALAAFAAVSVGAAGCGGSEVGTPAYGAPAPITGGATGAGGMMPVPAYGISPYMGSGGETSAPHYGLPPLPTGGTAGTTKDAGNADAAHRDAAPGAGSFRGGPP